MSYNKLKPADDDYLSEFPADEREQQRSIIEDRIVDAGKLQGLQPSNNEGQISINNGLVNTNLNADKLDGKDASDFSLEGHRHDNATISSDGFMSKEDKVKLDGVQTNAEVNQNAYSNVKVGNITLQADSKQDTLVLTAGKNISLGIDSDNDSITVNVDGTVDAAKAAQKLANQINLSLTGKAIGNATTDGSSDIQIEVTSVNADTAEEATHAANSDNAKEATHAASADKLTNPVKINGQSFDGTSDINIKVDSVAGSNLTFSQGSTQTGWDGSPISGGGTVNLGKITSHTFNGSATITGSGLTVAGAFGAGTYSLTNVLQKLINCCHSHGSKSTSSIISVAGDCQCNCNCSDNDEE